MEFIWANVRIAENSAKCAEWDYPAFVDGHGHTLIVRCAPHVQVTAALSLFLKASALQGPNQLLTIDARQFVAHAVTGTDKRVINSGSRSTGIGSPSCCILST